MRDLIVGGKSYEVFRLDARLAAGDVKRLPYSLRVLLENALRHGDEDAIDAILSWDAREEPSREIGFRPARVLLQDFTGVPALVDLARDAGRGQGARRRSELDRSAASCRARDRPLDPS